MYKQPKTRQYASFAIENIALLAGLAFVVIVAALLLSNIINELTGQSTALNNKDKEVVSAIAPVEKKSTQSVPARLIAPSVDLGVSILDSTVDLSTNNWPLSDSAAHYANYTAKLGDARGTMLIYGHNTMDVMYKTNNLKVNDVIYLVDKDGVNWKFKLAKEETVYPTDTAFITEDTSFRVVMFTCYGWKDEFRRLMFFEPIQ